MLDVDILLIDDDETEFEILLEALKGFPVLKRCVHANSAETALLMLDKLRARFIFVDMQMPVVQGLDCIGMLIRAGHNERSRVIMYSLYMDDELCEKTISAGGDGCLKKPLTVPELTEMLKKMFNDGEQKFGI